MRLRTAHKRKAQQLERDIPPSARLNRVSRAAKASAKALRGLAYAGKRLHEATANVMNGSVWLRESGQWKHLGRLAREF